MIALLMKFGLSEKAAGYAAMALAILLFLAGLALALWRMVAIIDGRIEAAATAARAERDAHWQSEIARSNAEAERARADQAAEALAAEAMLKARESALQTQLKTLEETNAALSGGDRCGLDRDRVRLLDAQ